MKFAIHFLWTASFLSAAQARNFFVFGCGCWYDREIVLLPHYGQYIPRETMRETTRQLCLRAAQQQAGASPVTAVSIGSGSAALVVGGVGNFCIFLAATPIGKL